jgi:hypothetical protein
MSGITSTQLQTLRITLNEVGKLLADAERCAEIDDGLRQLIGGIAKAADSIRLCVEMRLDTVTRLPQAGRSY